MAFPFVLTVSTHEIDALYSHYEGLGDGKILLKARRRAMRRTLESVRTEARRITRERYTSRDPRPLKEWISIEDKGSDAIEGKLDISGRWGRGLRHFSPSTSPPKRAPEGVSNLIRMEGQRKVYEAEYGEKPFWMRTKQGFYALFTEDAAMRNRVRQYRKRRGIPGKSWKSYSMLFGPSGAQALLPETSRERMLKKAQTTLTKRMEHELMEILGLV